MRNKIIQRNILTKAKQYFPILLCVFFSLNALFAQDMPLLKGDFNIKPVHSFGFQYNGYIIPKVKFTNQNPNPNAGWDPLVSYGNELIIKYNYASASGFGFTLEALQGTMNYKYHDRHDPFFPTTITQDAIGLLVPLLWNYVGFNVKFSYIRRITPFLFIQPEIGLKLVHYPTTEFGYTITGWSNDTTIDYYARMEYDNYNCHREFFPDLTMNLNFLFHTKRNPRNNFLIGVNANIGFVTRYTGYYTITPPYTSAQKDCDIRIGSTYFGFNFGYEFTGLQKPLYRTKAYRKAQPFQTFDFSKPIHSVGLLFSLGTSFDSRIREKIGVFSPNAHAVSVPEMNLRYNITFAKGWGITAEIPFGMFHRYTSYPLEDYIHDDSVWSRGAVGGGYGNAMLLHYRRMRVCYLGLALKASYLAQIHRKMFIQPEVGIKFMPFLRSADNWSTEESDDWEIPYIDSLGNKTDIVWLNDYPTFKQQYYAVPDLTLAVNFMVHGKQPHHNFVFGVNANLCFVDRVGFRYETTNELPERLKSSGKYGWRTTSIAFHFGYQFMKGQTVER